MAEANRSHASAEKERAESLLKTGGITDKDHLSAQVVLQVAEAALAQARAEAAIAGQQLERTRVKAPFAGRVGRRHADPGAMLAAGAPLFTLVVDSVLEFSASVPSRDFPKVRLGAGVSVSVDALPGARIEGRVSRIAPLVDERTRSFTAVVEVEGRPELVGGLFARASMKVGTAKGAIVLPPAALVRDGSDLGRGEVFVVLDTPGGAVSAGRQSKRHRWRLIGKHITDSIGQQVVVDNRAGAGGTIGADVVAKANPDGYTLLVTSTTLTISPSVYRKLPYDVDKDLQPVTMIGSAPMLVFVNTAVPANTLQELMAYIKARPGQFNFSSGGTGTVPHFAGELLNYMAKIRMTHVPYKGGAPASAAMISGEVSMYIDTPTAMLQC